MKTKICLLLCAALLALSACGQPVYREKPASAPAETEAAEPAPETAETAEPEAEDDLTPLLGEIRERMHPGTAGSSLTAAELGCKLMDWCARTGMGEAQARAVTERYLEGLDDEGRAAFAEQLGAVSGAIGRLLDEGGQGLLDDIGGGPEGTLWPWTDVPRGRVEAVLDAAGVEF